MVNWKGRRPEFQRFEGFEEDRPGVSGEKVWFQEINCSIDEAVTCAVKH